MDFKIALHKGMELLPCERFALYNWVKEIQPKVIFEVGTGRGGATHYMAGAMKDYCTPGIEEIHTCDPFRKPFPDLFRKYPFINFYELQSKELLKEFKEENINIDFIMFDGPEDPDVAINDLLFLEGMIKNGTHFCMHDWETESGRSIKAKLVRPYIENSENWEKIQVLTGYDCKTVGLCLYKFVKK